ncbi:nuclear transport factor 2 family protein [Microlunatus parietis]|uniref:Ketosteroid isomerase-like protein n=1 Tax=Microlunatus parietis TaxID=682979 RepID=A0A7Y9IBL7_9ACTN|nr:nuclear transport factor 2 family protein [Microlunatus parietis]NYE73938.1 ketosteroid isomerase-like protein [Microlunatus parietis]
MTEHKKPGGLPRRAALGMVGGATIAGAAGLARPTDAVATGRQDRTRIVHAFYRALQAKDIDAFAELWTEDAVYRVPVDPAGKPGALVGREAIVSGLRGFFALFGKTQFTWEVEPLRDPNQVMATWSLDIELLAGGRYRNRGVAIFRFRRNRIVEFVEYFDTAAFLGVFAAKIDTARRFFHLLHTKEIDAWAELWHEQGKIIVPYPPDGFPSVIDGKTEILRSFRELFEVYQTFDTELTGVHPAVDSDAICVEYTVAATLINGERYTNDNLAVFRFQDGLISAYHDYFDPRRFAEVIDALPGAGR